MVEQIGDSGLYLGDCLEILPTIERVDALVTDPPYGLSFMGKDWDHQVPGERYWRSILDACKPGAHLLAFGGTRTFHRLAVAIEDAGWEIRDTIMWVYSQGFPKSLNVSKMIDKATGAEREKVPTGPKVKRMIPGADQDRTGSWIKDNGRTYQPGTEIPATDAAKQWDGWGTALKPAWEPIIVARKPFAGTVASNVLEHGTGALNIDGCRVSLGDEAPPEGSAKRVFANNRFSEKKKYGDNKTTPAAGRFPANLIHDGSEEVMGLFPISSITGNRSQQSRDASVKGTRWLNDNHQSLEYTDQGSAARFFKEIKFTEAELLFCRAKVILTAWKLNHANTVGDSSFPLRQQGVSVLSDVVIAASLGAKQLSDIQGLSTSVTESEYENLCITLIMAILSFGNAPLRDQLQGEPTLNGCRVKIVEPPKPTGTTTIMISLPKSGGYAGPVMFNIMPPNTAPGAKDSKLNRLIYCAKASKADRGEGNTQPTVKPTDLMRYLCRLVTPPGGIVLDPFMGSGSTGKAAILEGFKFIGIEKESDAYNTARGRLTEIKNQQVALNL